MASNSWRLLNVIMSRGRAGNLLTHRLVPNATLVVPESEVADYAGYGLTTIGVPDELHGISKVRNWILRRFDEEVVVMFDDDVLGCWSLVGQRRHPINRWLIPKVLTTAAQCAIDLGVSAFGWQQAWDVRKFDGSKPFNLVGWVGGVLGVVGREILWDENLTLKCDIDWCLQNLLKKRVIWQDNRFSFEQVRNRNVGGNARYRSPERVAAEMKYLRDKWGRHISFDTFDTIEKTSIHVQRRQSLKLA